jgi:glyoxylate reductase
MRIYRTSQRVDGCPRKVEQMTKARVFVSRRIPTAGLEILHKVADVEVWQDEIPPDYEVFMQKTQELDGLLCLLTDRIDRNLIQTAAGSLKVISQMAVGYDNIDVRAATEMGIPVGHTPGVLTDATADFAWALLMAAARRVAEADRYTHQGRWKTWGPTLLMGADIYGATLGIVGLGRIGQAVAKRALGFDMRVLYFDLQRRHEAEEELGVEYASFNKLLEQSDFVTVHIWLSEDTHHLFSDEQFERMKPSAILINSARGPIIDPEALYSALKTGKIAYAALDVTEPEPIPIDNPLLTLDNIIITPHIASASLHARTKMATMAAENLSAGLRGERLPHCVNPEIYK